MACLWIALSSLIVIETNAQTPWNTVGNTKGLSYMPYAAQQVITAYNYGTDEIWIIGGLGRFGTSGNRGIDNITTFNPKTQTFGIESISGITGWPSGNFFSKNGQQYVQGFDSTVYTLDISYASTLQIFNMKDYTVRTSTTNEYDSCSMTCLAYHNHASYGEFVFITGGLPGSKAGGSCADNNGTRRISVYDIANDTFYVYKPSWYVPNGPGIMNYPRRRHTCLVHPNNSFLYVIGGISQPSIERLNVDIDLTNTTKMNSWEVMELPAAQTNARSVAYDHYILVMGGSTVYQLSLLPVWKIDVLDGSVTRATFDLGSAVTNPGHILVNNVVYLFGGSTPDQATAYNTWQYQDITDTLSPTASPTEATVNPTGSSTRPSYSPSKAPTAPPTAAPSYSPTMAPISVLILKVGTCPDGYQPWNEKPDEYCQPCSEYEAGTLGKCDKCGDGKEPNNDQTACILCSGELIGVDGYCDVDCSDTEKIANEIHTECVEAEEAEAWYETSEFDAILSILGTLTGFSCIAAFIYAFCKKKLCWAQQTDTKEETQGIVEDAETKHIQVTSNSEMADTNVVR